MLQRLTTSAHCCLQHTLIVPCSIPSQSISVSIPVPRTPRIYAESTQPSRTSTTHSSLECFHRMMWPGSPRHRSFVEPPKIVIPFHSIPSPFHSNPMYTGTRHVCFGRPTRPSQWTRQRSLGPSAWATYLCSTTSWCTATQDGTWVAIAMQHCTDMALRASVETETTRGAGCTGDVSGVGGFASDSLCVGHVAGECLCACVLRLDLLGLLSVIHTYRYVCLL